MSIRVTIDEVTNPNSVSIRWYRIESKLQVTIDEVTNPPLFQFGGIESNQSCK